MVNSRTVVCGVAANNVFALEHGAAVGIRE